MIPAPMSSPRPHPPAVLPESPTLRVVRRGDPENVLLSYYQAPPLDERSSLHVLDLSQDEPANRVPFREAFAWPDESGLLHFGTRPDPNLGYVRAFSSESPARFFDLTDRFNGDQELGEAFFMKAVLSRPVASGPEFDPSAVRIITEDGADAAVAYSLIHENLGDGSHRVTVLAREATVAGQAIWARYRAMVNGVPAWISEPLSFTSWLTDQALGLGGDTHRLESPEGLPGYQVFVPTTAQEPYPNGTALLWRVKGTLSGRPVVTGWFTGWVSSEDGDKVLEELPIASILVREHPGATSASLESVKLWGGSLSVTTNAQGKPVASTDRSGVPTNLSEGSDRIRIPHRARAFLNAYEEATEGDISWQVTAKGKRLNVNPNDGHGGKGNGIWRIHTNKGGDSTKNDWSYSGHLPLYYRREPPDYFYVEFRVSVYVPSPGSFNISVANDDDVYIYVNGSQQYHRGSTRWSSWWTLYYDYYTAKLTLAKGWNEIYISSP